MNTASGRHSGMWLAALYDMSMACMTLCMAGMAGLPMRAGVASLAE